MFDCGRRGQRHSARVRLRLTRRKFEGRLTRLLFPSRFDRLLVDLSENCGQSLSHVLPIRSADRSDCSGGPKFSHRLGKRSPRKKNHQHTESHIRLLSADQPMEPRLWTKQFPLADPFK